MIVKKMKYIFLLIFTLQNYNFCCEECCDNCCEECWDNCWNNSTTDQDFFLQGEDIKNNNFALWKNKNTTKFETTDKKYGICDHGNFDPGNGFPYYEQFYIPTKEEIQKKRATSCYQNIHNYQNTVDFICKEGNYCVIVKNIFLYYKKDNNGNNNTSNLVYYVPVFLIYKKEQNVYNLKPNKSFFILIDEAKIDFSNNEYNENVDSWNKKIKEKIEENRQNLENIRDNIRDIGAIYDIDFSKKNVSNIKYSENIIDENFDLKNIQPNVDNGSCWRKGLENIGATCYMNATLQCFAHIPDFVNFFRKNKQVQDVINEKRGTTNLTTAFAELLQNLYPTNLENMKNKTYYAPKNFKKTISEMNPLFQGVAANDAKDLINFLIMTLHDELNKAQNPVDVGGGNLFQEQTNKELMFKRFAANFTANNQSLISDLFYALNCNVTKCGNCQTCSFNYQIYFFLIFPLEEVRKFNPGNNNLDNTVDIYDCFNFDQKIGMMGGENSMYCNYCKQTSPSYMCTNLTTGPEILIIILNRGKGIQFKVKINFYEKLDLSNYIELQQTGTQYELIGVITHLGESGMGGHFIAYCKDLWDNTWYEYNDAIVSPVDNFQTKVVNYAMPYVLFYKKTDNNMIPNNNMMNLQFNNINF